jgi:adenylylsulfate kinase
MKKGLTIWLTGYSGAGKTTLANNVKNILTHRGHSCELLDGDVIRQHLSLGLGFSKEDRCENIRRIGFVAELLSRHGIIVIVSAISPYKSARDEVHNRIPHFIEVYIKCSIEECERRDVKGLYKKAKAGELNFFTGISDPYEEPDKPDIICNTEFETVEQSTQQIIESLERLRYV